MVISDPNEAAAALAQVMRGKRTLAITGAGVSTDSGLPDYRGQGTTEKPSIDYDMFTADPVWQRWVWQRNHETWRQFQALQPSGAHTALARLETAGLIGIATQNIDGLHTKAGSKRVWELHGSFDRVRCLDCGARFPRADYAADLEALNPNWPQYDRDPAVLATADRPEAEASTFKVAPCPVCGGLVKPDVVFFGESLPASMGDAMEAARECEVALVAGSSLVVSTGMWIVRQAYAAGATLAIINYGPTAADTVADIRIDCGVSPTLTALADALC
ncbi:MULTISPECIES: Sir2 family NAD-dependent protein deacetylase [Trueperella]|uniref:protein acetyllysine N-acetyltransferase n=1 Tax=Trueperella abortisuis TaxID=445930 RepID=A0ABT9PKQ9_9ACTO|nr:MULTISPECIES: Sir2 family NAD-dependent protein deacetylase [Trueperella]MDP9833283.1 NAD-dependent SIR2 family protein deacetylase [Trueperella abortisuis]MDY5403164.1 Sir2 family NAD-dependent protein deacetylase [Trueperella sp.]